MSELATEWGMSWHTPHWLNWTELSSSFQILISGIPSKYSQVYCIHQKYTNNWSRDVSNRVYKRGSNKNSVKNKQVQIWSSCAERLTGQAGTSSLGEIKWQHFLSLFFTDFNLVHNKLFPVQSATLMTILLYLDLQCSAMWCCKISAFEMHRKLGCGALCLIFLLHSRKANGAVESYLNFMWFCKTQTGALGFKVGG